MTPKEKAEEIFHKIFMEQYNDKEAKRILISTPKIALLFVDEILKVVDNKAYLGSPALKYWEQVKTEIEKL